MNISPNINVTDQQFLALQKRAERMETTVEKMIENEVLRIATREIVSQVSCNGGENV